MNGILNLYKPVGVTSHDMIYLVRRAAGQRRVGHTGTLDPCAEGVLPVLLGTATKLSDMLTAQDKEYTATVRLGVTTDTYDMDGAVVDESGLRPEKAAIEEAVRSFVGEQMQLPPIYSALKKDGKPLYQLAREGKTVAVEPRRIVVYSIAVSEVDEAAGRFQMAVHCSKGTYIRSLCHDIGQRLGCGAAMERLVRRRSGVFEVSNAIPAERVKAMTPEELEQHLMPMDAVLEAFAPVAVNAEMERKIRNGLRMRPDQYGIRKFALGERYRVYNESGALLCLSEIIADGGTAVLKQLKSF